MFQQTFGEPSQDVFLPTMEQDESLSAPQTLNRTSFPSHQQDSLEALNLPSPEPLPFDTSEPSSTLSSTLSLASQSREVSTNLFQQPGTFHSEPCTPRPHSGSGASAGENNRAARGIEGSQFPLAHPGHYAHHAADSSNSSYHTNPNDHLYYHNGGPQPGYVAPPPHFLHQRAHSQPPEQVTFFRAPHQSSRSTKRTFTGGIPLSNNPVPISDHSYNANPGTVHSFPVSKSTSRYREHPYRSSSRSRRETGPTSVPPQHMMSSPRPMSSRSMYSSTMQGAMHQAELPMFVRMQTPEEQTVSGAQSPHAIEVGAARVTTALGNVLVNTGGTMSPAHVADILKFVNDVERKQRETLEACERIRSIFVKKMHGIAEADADVEPLRLDAMDENWNRSLEPTDSVEEPSKTKASHDTDIKMD